MMVRVIGAVLVVVGAMLGTRPRVFGCRLVVLGRRGMIAVGLVHPRREVQGMSLRVGVGSGQWGCPVVNAATRTAARSVAAAPR
jgi:hypothetical protein